MNFIKSFFSPDTSKEPGDDEDDIAPPPAKGAYEIDYSKFDDPNFNPFETKTKITNTFDEPADEQPVKGNILLENVMKGICRVVYRVCLNCRWRSKMHLFFIQFRHRGACHLGHSNE